MKKSLVGLLAFGCLLTTNFASASTLDLKGKITEIGANAFLTVVGNDGNTYKVDMGPAQIFASSYNFLGGEAVPSYVKPVYTVDSTGMSTVTATIPYTLLNVNDLVTASGDLKGNILSATQIVDRSLHGGSSFNNLFGIITAVTPNYIKFEWTEAENKLMNPLYKPYDFGYPSSDLRYVSEQTIYYDSAVPVFDARYSDGSVLKAQFSDLKVGTLIAAYAGPEGYWNSASKVLKPVWTPGGAEDGSKFNFHGGSIHIRTFNLLPPPAKPVASTAPTSSPSSTPTPTPAAAKPAAKKTPKQMKAEAQKAYAAAVKAANSKLKISQNAALVAFQQAKKNAQQAFSAEKVAAAAALKAALASAK